MRNNKGFTLIELLAAVVILGIIMAVATPNIIGVLKSSKDKTIIEDAKKFVSTVEYKLKTGKIDKPINDQCIVVFLSYIDDSEFKNAPNGEPYKNDKNQVNNASAVFIRRDTSGEYKYAVLLAQSDGRGVIVNDKNELYDSDATKKIYSDVTITGGTPGQYWLMKAGTSTKTNFGCMYSQWKH